ncbi:MAG: YdjY domain-containing protein [Phycisphaerales bacterium]|nr:YdjY domain-containing protein [Phycisphaerales bacterium]
MLKLIIAFIYASIGTTSFSFTDEPQAPLHELLPGLFVGEGVVEFDGKISIDCHHPDTPDVFLEMLVTAPDSREHESLVVTTVNGSSLHAALLAAGFYSGKPISRDNNGQFIPAHGDGVSVLVATQFKAEDEDSLLQFKPIVQWVTHVETGDLLVDTSSWTGFVFAGSIFKEYGYGADANGTLISLTNFGDEVIAPTWTISSSADIDEPVWIANRASVGKIGEQVRIRIVAHTVEGSVETNPESHEPDRIDIDRDL